MRVAAKMMTRNFPARRKSFGFQHFVFVLSLTLKSLSERMTWPRPPGGLSWLPLALPLALQYFPDLSLESNVARSK